MWRMLSRRQGCIDMPALYRPFLGTTNKFSEAFPEMEQLSIDVVQDRWGYHLEPKSPRRRMTFNQRNVPSHLSCCNPRCQRGGLDFQRILFNLAATRQTEDTIEMNCSGDEGTPKGRRRGASCDNGYQVV